MSIGSDFRNFRLDACIPHNKKREDHVLLNLLGGKAQYNQLSILDLSHATWVPWMTSCPDFIPLVSVTESVMRAEIGDAILDTHMMKLKCHGSSYNDLYKTLLTKGRVEGNGIIIELSNHMTR